MGYLATGEIFENMLQLKRFGLYFEGIMNRKGLWFDVVLCTVYVVSFKHTTSCDLCSNNQ